MTDSMEQSPSWEAY